MAKPTYVYNQIPIGIGYPWAGTEATIVGTGAESSVDLGRTVSNGLKLESGAAGRSFYIPSVTIPAARWFSLLVEITDLDLSAVSGATDGNACIKIPTAGEAGGTKYVTIDQIKAGGAGWYCITVQYAAETSPTVRIGVGTDTNLAADAYITVGRIGWFLHDEETIPDFALPKYGASYATSGNTVDANRKVVWGTTVISDINKYSVIYSIGDSKSNDRTVDACTRLQIDRQMNVYTYARSGEGYDYMITNIADLQAQKSDMTDQVQRDIWTDMDEFPKTPLRPDSLMFCNFPVNDLIGSAYTGEQLVANLASLASTLGYDDVIFTDINPWGAVADAGQEAETLSFNALAKAECRSNGWVFVPLYYDLSDQPTNPDNLLAAYTADGLHPNATASLVITGLIDCAIQEWRQRGVS